LELEVTVTVSVDVPPPAVMDVGVKLGETPVVAPPGVKVTVPPKPAVGVIVTVYVAVTLPLPGRFTDCEPGDMLTLNVGAAGAVTTRAADVVCVKVPSVPEIVKL
jgi:hypothetical protein